MATTRREVMFGAAALGMAGAGPVRAAIAASTRAGPDPDVIVLGAGVAGLNAAALLEAQGSRVLVLEGRRRVGGRILTLFDQPGTPELGFNSMGAGYGRGIDAAQRAGVELYDVGPRYTRDSRQHLVVGGTAFTRDEWRASPANPLPTAWRDLMPWEVVPAAFAKHNPLRDWTDWQAPTSAPLDRSVHDFLVDQGLSEPAIRLVFDAAPYYGSDSFDAGALTYAFNAGWVAAQAAAGPGSFAVRGGNQKLPEAMAARLKGDVLLGREVTAIVTDAVGVEVRTRDGGRFRAKRVVCTLPFATLRNVAIEPGLIGAQAQAVATLPYAPISIAFLRVRAPYWRNDGLPVSMWTDGPLGAVLAQRYGTDPDEVTGLLVFARGKLALYWDRLGRDTALALIVAELARLRPASRGQVAAAALHSWALEPMNGGDWAYFAPGQITAFAAAMARPAGRVHFCGEHTAVGNRGLEGALESSERAVLEIVTA